MYKIWLYIC